MPYSMSGCVCYLCVLLVRGTSLEQDNGWELHVPSEVCLVGRERERREGRGVGTHHKLQCAISKLYCMFV